MKKERLNQLVESLAEVREQVTTGRFIGRIHKVELVAGEVGAAEKSA